MENSKILAKMDVFRCALDGGNRCFKKNLCLITDWRIEKFNNNNYNNFVFVIKQRS